MAKNIYFQLCSKLFMPMVLLCLCMVIGSTAYADSQRGTMSDGFGTYIHRNYNGVDYVHKNRLTTILLMGIDKNSHTDNCGYQDGGQCDFLMLVVIDESTKTVRRLQIDRDTMAEVSTLNVLGHPNGSRVLQLCLSHGFGGDQKACCNNTVKAVSHLLENEEIEFYISTSLDSISIINDLLGGVTVTLSDDMSAIDPAMRPGVTLTLTGKQAEFLFRSRYDIADGTNAMRMNRQLIYMNAAETKLKKLLNDDSGFAAHMLDALENSLTMNISRGRLINEINRAYRYKIYPVEYLEGEYIIDEDGFIQFYTNADSITAWVRNVFYKLP